MKRKTVIETSNAPTPLWTHIAEQIRASCLRDDQDSNDRVATVECVGQPAFQKLLNTTMMKK